MGDEGFAENEAMEAAEARHAADEAVREKLDSAESDAGPREAPDAAGTAESAPERSLSPEETESTRQRLDAGAAAGVDGEADQPEAKYGEGTAQARDLKDHVREGIDRVGPTEGERHIIGSPEEDKQYRKDQGDRPTCAIAAQEGIIEKHTGRDPGQEALKEEAVREGWAFEKGGTKEDCLGNLLERHGVPCEQTAHADGAEGMQALEHELAQGHDVIVGVDAGKLYDVEAKEGKGHALWVTGVEVDESGNPTRVFVNDSNTSQRESYTAEEFQEAWEERGCTMVATRKSARRA